MPKISSGNFVPYINKNDNKQSITLPKYFADESINEFKKLKQIINNEPIENWLHLNLCKKINKRKFDKFIFTNTQRKNLMFEYNKRVYKEINKMQFNILQNNSKNIVIKNSSHINHEYESLLNIIKNEPLDESWSKFNFCERINKRDENGAFIFSNSQRKNLILEYDKKVNGFLVTLAS